MKSCLWILLLAIFFSGCSLISFEESDVLTLHPSKDYQILEADEDIRVRFSDDVETYTAEQILSVSNLDAKLNCRFTWENKRSVLLEPEDSLIPGLQYKLEAKGIYNTEDNLAREVDFSVPFYYLSDDYSPLKVISFTPEEGSVIDDNSEIIVVFNRAPDEASLIKNMTLSPDTAFDYTLSAGELRISPGDKWENLADYSLSLGRDTLDLEGVLLDPGLELNFTVIAGTSIPSVVLAGAAENDYSAGFPFKTVNSGLLEYDDCYRIIFSEDMDKSSVEDAFSLSPALAGDIYWDGDNGMIFKPETGWVMGTEYSLRISTEGKSADGIILSEDYYSHLTPALELLELNSIECLTGSGFTLNSYSSAVYRDLPVEAVSPYSIVFRLVFSTPFSSDKEKQSVQEHISCYEVFSSDGSPRASSFSWSNDLTLTIVFSGFNAAADRDHYYILELEGGAQGIRNDQGSFMLSTIEQLFRTRL